MATNAKLGIQTSADVGPIKTLQAELAKIPELFKAWNSAMTAFGPVVESVVSKATKVFQDGEQKVTEAKQQSSDKIKALFNAMAVNGEMARQREVKSEQEANAKIEALKQSEAQKEESLRAKAEQKATEEQAKANARAQSEAQKEQARIQAREQKEQQAEQKIAAQAEQAAKRKAAATGNADKQIQEITERRVRFEKQAASLKYEDAKEKYKEQVVAFQNMTNAMNQAASKEDKAEIQGRLNVLKEEKQAYEKNLKERPETKKGKSSDIGMLGTKREGEHGNSLLEGAGIGVGIELFKKGTEAAKEYANANATLNAQLGKDAPAAKKDVEEIGDEFSASDEKIAVAMAHAKAATGASGEELKKQTEAALAYEVATGKSADKMQQTATGRAKIMADAERNIAIAREKGNDPIMKAQHAQEKLESVIGKLATTVIGSLAPAISAVGPILDVVGNLVETAVKPAMESLQPVIILISESVKQLAPIIGELLKGALTVIAPIIASVSGILGDLIPPIIQIVKEVSEGLTPIFKELGPLIAQIVQNQFTQMTAVLQILLPVIADLLPPLLQLISAVLIPLLPLLTQVSKLFGTVLTAGIKAVSGILLFLVDKAIKPVITWFTGGLSKAINEVVGTITKAVGAISSIVNSVTSFLGIGSKAVAAKDGADVVKAASTAAQQEAANQAAIALGNEQKRSREALAQKLKLGKISEAEEQELRDQAQSENDQAMLKRLDDFDKKKETRAAKAGKNAVKSAAEQARIRADAELDALKDSIIENNETEKKARVDELTGEVAHAAAILAVYKEGTKEYAKAHAAFTSANKNLTAAQHADALEDQKNASEKQLSELEISGIKENLSEYEIAQKRFAIEQQALDAEITLRKSFGEDVSKLKAQFDANDLKHAAEEKKNAMAAEKELTQIKREADKRDLEDMKSRHFAESIIAKMETEFALTEEGERHKEELEKLKGNDAAIQVENAKNADAVAAITKHGVDRQKQILISQSQYLAGPIAAGFTNGFKKMMKGADDWTAKMTDSNNIMKSILGSILQGFTQMIEGLIIKFIEYEAAFTVLNIITGGGASALMGAFSAVSALGLPGHAAGTDSSPGGLHWVGEKGPELMNVPSGAQIIPNHHLPNLGQPPVDLSPLLGTLNAIHAGIQQSNRTFAERPAPVLPVNDYFRQTFNQSANAEARRSA